MHGERKLHWFIFTRKEACLSQVLASFDWLKYSAKNSQYFFHCLTGIHIAKILLRAKGTLKFTSKINLWWVRFGSGLHFWMFIVFLKCVRCCRRVQWSFMCGRRRELYSLGTRDTQSASHPTPEPSFPSWGIHPLLWGRSHTLRSLHQLPTGGGVKSVEPPIGVILS